MEIAQFKPSTTLPGGSDGEGVGFSGRHKVSRLKHFCVVRNSRKTRTFDPRRFPNVKYLYIGVVADRDGVVAKLQTE
jgi:hypothetical protein